MMLYVVRGRRVGFTLIEIMIVIAIIAILAGIVVPNFLRARQEAQLEACFQNCKALVEAAHMASVRCSMAQLAEKVGSYGTWVTYFRPGSASTSPFRDLPAGDGDYCFLDDECPGVNEFLTDYGYTDRIFICPATGVGYSVNYNLSYWDYVRNSNFDKVSMPAHTWSAVCSLYDGYNPTFHIMPFESKVIGCFDAEILAIYCSELGEVYYF